jgi:hypothetical protein
LPGTENWGSSTSAFWFVTLKSDLVDATLAVRRDRMRTVALILSNTEMISSMRVRRLYCTYKSGRLWIDGMMVDITVTKESGRQDELVWLVAHDR